MNLLNYATIMEYHFSELYQLMANAIIAKSTQHAS